MRTRRQSSLQRALKPVANRLVILLATGSVSGMLWLSGSRPVPRLVWNASESVPLGFYLVEPGSVGGLMNLVLAAPPQPLALWLAERGYVPRGVPLIKR